MTYDEMIAEASGIFLVKKLPDDHCDMDDKQFYAFIEEHVTEAFKDMSSEFIYEKLIEEVASLMLKVTLEEQTRAAKMNKLI